MSKLSKLQGKSKVVTIGEIELELKPLSLKDLHLFNVDKSASAAEQMKQTNMLVSKVLKDSVPDATEEEISSIGMKYLEPLMNAIMDVNGFSDEKTKLIKDKLGR